MSSSPPPAGTLFVVATPIGNLGDMSPRAIDTLRHADLVLAEDTRRTRGLLTHFAVAEKEVRRFDRTASEEDVRRLADRIGAGSSLALVTDAGTPVVSDPGTALVREAHARGFRVVPIPGPSAVLAALSASGLVTGGFRFVGFLPRKGMERTTMIADVRESTDTVVLFEAAARLPETLRDLAERMPQREAVVARELTKTHEEILRGTLAELAALEREWLGEATLVLGPWASEADTLTAEQIDARIDAELEAGKRPREVADAVAVWAGVGRREVYARVLERKKPRA